MAATSLRREDSSDTTADCYGTGERTAVLGAYQATRALSLELARPLSPEDQQVQSMDDASPTKWHLAHVTWFFETFLAIPHGQGYAPFHPRYGYIFNSYYEAIGPRHARPRRGLLTRPPLEDVLAYRAHVDAAMDRLIADADDATWAEIAPMIALGIHHEQQHQELLLTDIKHALCSQPLVPAYRDDLPVFPDGDGAGQRRFIPIAGGEVEIGHGGEGFGFDNETPRHKVRIEDCALASHPVTNGEYLEFIEAGGYETATLWLADGWAWVEAGAGNMEGEMAPLYWRRRDGAWWEFTLGGERPLDPTAPVSHLTYFEADAYARFAGARLPTEAEWETAAAMTAGPEGPEGEGANLLARGYLHPVRPDARAGGFAGLFGDTWEWTQSAYAPYPGFKPCAGAVGEYNGKFMVSQLVLKGGSCVTPPGHIRPSYRNFFYPHQNWQFTGLRLAEDR
ncbi:MAG TPA: ergothioneine biosynthesis protein EgtB [Alphaproteobacteria bacterium]|nr:ergothioneine biosynthesis protein EgtB [Alphaproteobacteria bacterium]